MLIIPVKIEVGKGLIGKFEEFYDHICDRSSILKTLYWIIIIAEANHLTGSKFGQILRLFN